MQLLETPSLEESRHLRLHWVSNKIVNPISYNYCERPYHIPYLLMPVRPFRYGFEARQLTWTSVNDCSFPLASNISLLLTEACAARSQRSPSIRHAVAIVPKCLNRMFCGRRCRRRCCGIRIKRPTLCRDPCFDFGCKISLGTFVWPIKSQGVKEASHNSSHHSPLIYYAWIQH